MEYQEVITTQSVPQVVSPEFIEPVEIIRPELTPEAVSPSVERVPLETKIMDSVRDGKSYDRIFEQIANNDFPDAEVLTESNQDSQMASEGVLFDSTSQEAESQTIREQSEPRRDIFPTVKEDPLFQQKLGEVIQEQQKDGEVDIDAAEQEAYRRYMEEQEVVEESDYEVPENTIQEEFEEFIQKIEFDRENMKDSLEIMQNNMYAIAEFLKKLMKLLAQEEEKKRGDKDPYVQSLKDMIMYFEDFMKAM